MKVTIRIGGGYVVVHEGKKPDEFGYLLGYGAVMVAGGVRLRQQRTFRVKGGTRAGAVAERIIQAGVINVHVQKEDEEYGYVPSEYVAKHWPVKVNTTGDKKCGKWSETRDVWKEMEAYAKKNPEYKYVPPPTLFSQFSVSAYFNHGTFSADKERVVVGSNMTTKEAIVRSCMRVDFEVPADEELVVTVATPRSEGREVFMHEEEWIELKGLGVIDSVQIEIDPLDAYASLPLLGYEGGDEPPSDQSGGGIG
jgi:hypothetical protein